LHPYLVDGVLAGGEPAQPAVPWRP
jgi:hypothetical protein